MTTTWSPNMPVLGEGCNLLSKWIYKMSAGRLDIKVYGGGELVPSLECFDAVSHGAVEMGSGASYYWAGKIPAAQFFSSVPFGMNSKQMNSWIISGGGHELYKEIYEPFGLLPFAGGNTSIQMGGWFNKEINSANDLKGLKMRIPGLGGDVMAKLGASPVSLPGGQIYENLVSGAIDATEWVGPWNDEIMKFYEAAKYYYFPGMHEPGSALAAGCNKSWLTSLSNSDQVIIEAAAAMENDVMMAEYNPKNGAALARLVNEQGVIVKEFSDDTFDSFGEAADEVYAEVVEHSGLAKRIHESMVKSRTEVGGWLNLGDAAYSRQRNRVLGL